jgi:hypothetical protein
MVAKNLNNKMVVGLEVTTTKTGKERYVIRYLIPAAEEWVIHKKVYTNKEDARKAYEQLKKATGCK